METNRLLVCVCALNANISAVPRDPPPRRHFDEKERTQAGRQRLKIRSIDLQRRGKEFAQRLDELLKRCRPRQVDGGGPEAARMPGRHSGRCLREISIAADASADCYAVTRAGREALFLFSFFFFGTNNHLIQSPLLFYRQHGRKHSSIKIQ